MEIKNKKMQKNKNLYIYKKCFGFDQKKEKREKDKKFITMYCQLTHQKGKMKCRLPATEMVC